ncbi:MAG: hypothetical protein ACFFCW_45270 [Candidatus Hodarchaeota archaeon]
MVLKRSSLIFFILVQVVLISSVRADWINLTGAQSSPNIAEIYVEVDPAGNVTYFQRRGDHIFALCLWRFVPSASKLPPHSQGGIDFVTSPVA